MSEDGSTCIFLSDLKHVVVANNRLQINGNGTTIRGIFVVGTTPGNANAGVISANNIHLNSTARSRRGVELDNDVTNHGVWNNTIEGATAKAGVILGSGAGNVASNNLLI